METLAPPFFYISEEDEGIYDAMNKGIGRSKGIWLYFLGADDKLCSSNTLEKVSSELDDNFTIVSGAIQYDFDTNDSYFVKKQKGLFVSKWSSKLWVKNTVHHQATFYNKKVFKEGVYNTTYKILADYAFNLLLYVKKMRVKNIDTTVALCKTGGTSKNYTWKLYKEEIHFKTALSSKLLQPLFFKIAFLKFVLKKIF